MSLCPRRAPYFRGSGWLTRPGQTPDTRPGLTLIFPSGGTHEKTQVTRKLLLQGGKWLLCIFSPCQLCNKMVLCPQPVVLALAEC